MHSHHRHDGDHRFHARRAGRDDSDSHFGRHDGGRHERGGRGGRGGGRRMFESGELKLVLLRLLEDQPRHGYDFIREIETRTGGAYVPSPGVVYPTLTLLDDLGHIAEARADGTRRLYSITDAGRAELEANRADAEAATARLSALGAERERVDGGPVRRAMHNLKEVLHQRLASEGVDRQILFDVAAIIDEAAGRIERL
ncbi:DNA-binding PadR family transcriptional regulator [Stella humosa]|uniref:DNA-binding PadR family transcriptional regulator n=1 Tax=Stella humosa TaxID=94 RepID=A0A3N1KWH9_9PROT|nr:PadR family transcriptional regulator [Stella humosa]ROP83169.1 DNA-binding PadR family transcriptional regulator [Stella humosa]BBK30054.1 PadR family transcriptional regulator [Stella humosa]